MRPSSPNHDCFHIFCIWKNLHNFPCVFIRTTYITRLVLLSEPSNGVPDVVFQLEKASAATRPILACQTCTYQRIRYGVQLMATATHPVHRPTRIGSVIHYCCCVSN